MGTNYYAEIRDEKQTELHIGKSSFGWAFSLRQHTDIGIETLYDWLLVLSRDNVVIRDEYGRQVGIKEMVDEIMNRKRYTVIDMTQSELDLNCAIIDSRYNLLRTNEVGRWGEGTWDYCNYEFC